MDLSRPLGDADFATVLVALGRHGVLHFPQQRLEAPALRDFSQRFGHIQATLSGRHHEPGMPEVGFGFGWYGPAKGDSGIVFERTCDSS